MSSSRELSHAPLDKHDQVHGFFKILDRGVCFTREDMRNWLFALKMWHAWSLGQRRDAFLNLLEESDIYKPTFENGKPKAPKKALSEFETDANKR